MAACRPVDLTFLPFAFTFPTCTGGFTVKQSDTFPGALETTQTGFSMVLTFHYRHYTCVSFVWSIK